MMYNYVSADHLRRNLSKLLDCFLDSAARYDTFTAQATQAAAVCDFHVVAAATTEAQKAYAEMCSYDRAARIFGYAIKLHDADNPLTAYIGKELTGDAGSKID